MYGPTNDFIIEPDEDDDGFYDLRDFEYEELQDQIDEYFHEERYLNWRIQKAYERTFSEKIRSDKK